MHLVKNPHNPPERYNEVEPLRTYIETSAFTIYGHGPIGINPFAHLFKTIGFQSTIAFIKPWHWERLIDAYPNKQHILLLSMGLCSHVLKVTGLRMLLHGLQLV